MNNFRKKPVVIEAMQYDGNPLPIQAWAYGHVAPYDGMIRIETLEGTMYARVGDYIIKGVQGEFYPCKPDIFKATYEKVED